MRFCRDCRWCKYPEDRTSACFHALAIAPALDIVTGQPTDPLVSCALMRSLQFGPCGVEARLFEARDGVVVPPIRSWPMS
jgi:hypothetical protein